MPEYTRKIANDHKAEIIKLAIEKYHVPQEKAEEVVDHYILDTLAACDGFYGDPKNPIQENQIRDPETGKIVAGDVETNPAKQAACEELFLDGKIRSGQEMRDFSRAGDIPEIIDDFNFQEPKRYLTGRRNGDPVTSPDMYFHSAAELAIAPPAALAAKKLTGELDAKVTPVIGGDTGALLDLNLNYNFRPEDPKLQYGVGAGGSFWYVTPGTDNTLKGPFATGPNPRAGLAAETESGTVWMDNQAFGSVSFPLHGTLISEEGATTKVPSLPNDKAAETEAALKERFGDEIGQLYINSVLAPHMSKSSDFKETWDLVITKGVEAVKALLTEAKIEPDRAEFLSDLFKYKPSIFAELLKMRVGEEELKKLLAEKEDQKEIVIDDDTDKLEDADRLALIKTLIERVNAADLPPKNLKEEKGFDFTTVITQLAVKKDDIDPEKFKVTPEAIKAAGEEVAKAQETTHEELKKKAAVFDENKPTENYWKTKAAVEEYVGENSSAGEQDVRMHIRAGQVNSISYNYASFGGEFQLDYLPTSKWTLSALVMLGSGASGFLAAYDFESPSFRDGFAFGLSGSAGYKHKFGEKIKDKIGEVSGSAQVYYRDAGSGAADGTPHHFGVRTKFGAKVYKNSFALRLEMQYRMDDPKGSGPVKHRYFVEPGVTFAFEPHVAKDSLVKGLYLDLGWSWLNGDRGDGSFRDVGPDGRDIGTIPNGMGAGAYTYNIGQSSHYVTGLVGYNWSENFATVLGLMWFTRQEVTDNTTTSSDENTTGVLKLKYTF